MTEARRLRLASVDRLGDDLRLIAYPSAQEGP
jgi:hypothetical protein